MLPLKVFAFQAAQTGDFIVAVGYSADSAEEVVRHQISDAPLLRLGVIDVLLDQYNGACYLTLESGR